METTPFPAAVPNFVFPTLRPKQNRCVFSSFSRTVKFRVFSLVFSSFSRTVEFHVFFLVFSSFFPNFWISLFFCLNLQTLRNFQQKSECRSNGWRFGLPRRTRARHRREKVAPLPFAIFLKKFSGKIFLNFWVWQFQRGDGSAEFEPAGLGRHVEFPEHPSIRPKVPDPTSAVFPKKV